MAQPLRKIRQRIAPAVPKGGFSFTLPPLAAGAVCIVMLACIGWAFFMGYMVGHGQNPGEEMRELTGIGRPDRETLAEMDKAMAGSEDAGLRDKLADLSRQPVGGPRCRCQRIRRTGRGPCRQELVSFQQAFGQRTGGLGQCPQGRGPARFRKNGGPGQAPGGDERRAPV